MYGGSFCLEQDKYDRALNYLDFAGRLDPKNPTIFFYKGVALVELEKKEDERLHVPEESFLRWPGRRVGILKGTLFRGRELNRSALCVSNIR